MSRDGIRVGKVHYGQGVFADRPFRKGELIGVVRGRVIDDPDYWSDYCIDLGGSLSLEPWSPYRFLNHCCTPNCQLWIIEEAQRGGKTRRRIVLEAQRPIRPDEQLTIDYGWPADSAMPCQCESPACRGWIVAEEELAQVVVQA